jgi:large subunit ribosomal protein L22
MGKQATPSKFKENQAGATAKFLRVPPRKARLVIDAVRGKYVSDALAILKFVPNFAARAIEDVIESAVANAESGRPNSEATGKPLNPLLTENLRLVRAFVDEGPRIKRLQPRAQGRAYRILKRMCHISVIVEEVAPKPRKVAKPKASGRRSQPAATPSARPAAKKAAPEKRAEEVEPEAAMPVPAVEAPAPVVEETTPVETVAAEAEAASAEAVIEEPTTEAVAEDSAVEAAEEAEAHETAPEEPKAQ